jgi:hypothetical protein
MSERTAPISIPIPTPKYPPRAILPIKVNAGDSYLLFVMRTALAPAFDLVDVAAGTGEFVIHGAETGDGSGSAVNNDGLDDLVNGAGSGDGPANAIPRSGEQLRRGPFSRIDPGAESAAFTIAKLLRRQLISSGHGYPRTTPFAAGLVAATSQI